MARTRQNAKTPNPATAARKLPEPPKKKHFLNLGTLSELNERILIRLSGSFSDVAATEDTRWVILEQLKFSDHEQSVVPLGHPVEQLAMASIYLVTKSMQKAMDPDGYEADPFKFDNLNGFITPFTDTPIYCNVEQVVVRLCAYVLSCGGKVTELNDGSGWGTEVKESMVDEATGSLKPHVQVRTTPIEYTEVADYLNFAYLVNEVDNDGEAPFMTILHTSGLFRRDAIQRDIELLQDPSTPEQAKELEEKTELLAKVEEQTKN